MAFNEADATNEIAKHERAIAGVRDSYGFAANPDTLPALPVVLHYSPGFESEPRAHYNVWKNTIHVRSILFVAPRQQAGGKLKFLENAAIPFGQKWRAQFQTASVLDSMQAATGAVKFFLVKGEYGVGGNELQFAGSEFVGWSFSFLFLNA